MAGFFWSCAVVPVDKQVDTGLHPQYQDDDVRFRTTYYFRVFDYCADEPKAAETPSTNNKDETDSGNIQTPFAIDSLYRFHMTGKADSLTTEVYFESGTLTAGQIDPFGATIAFDKRNKQHYFKSQGEVQREAARARQFEELGRLMERYRQLENELRPKTDETLKFNEANLKLLEEKKAALEKQKNAQANSSNDAQTNSSNDAQTDSSNDAKADSEIEKELKRIDNFIAVYKYLAANPPPDIASISPYNKKILDDFYRIINQQIELIIGKSVSTPDLTPEEIFEVYKNIVAQKNKLATENPGEDLSAYIHMLAILKNRLKRLSEAQIAQIESSQPNVDYCKNLRRGFQILGPEGWRTFNQDDRLIMAMTTSGKPLISTMEELSGRVLDNQPVEAELLLPLIEEDLRITRAERALERFSPSQSDQILTILEDAVTAFNGETRTEESK
jgi:hypothetical protein